MTDLRMHEHMCVRGHCCACVGTLSYVGSVGHTRDVYAAMLLHTALRFEVAMVGQYVRLSVRVIALLVVATDKTDIR